MRTLLFLFASFGTILQAQQSSPVRVGIVGLVHTHVHWILGREELGDIEIVGIVEPNRNLASEYSEMHGFPMDIVYNSIEEMVEATNPEAVTAFNTIFGHLEVVEYCAPRGIHVMVEKPLAVNLDHALRMAELAKEYSIHLLTNYETSWYGSIHRAKEMTENGEIGPIKRMVFNIGHPGPIEIGCNPEFLEWLTDPVLNGGGALTDFGCYGANIGTWFMDGEAPESVTCITRSLKPDMYPNVEDDATILLEYEDVRVVIQASWNWSHNRKDMTVYGTSGYITSLNGKDMVVMNNEEVGAKSIEAEAPSGPLSDPFAYLYGVVRGEIEPYATGLTSLENNLTVMRILHAARLSAERSSTIFWNELYGQ